MILFFADDSRQNKPTRNGMQSCSFFAIGGIQVCDDQLHSLNMEIEELCKKTGFPPGNDGEFKWSPDKKLWMHKNLTYGKRRDFWFFLIDVLSNHEVEICVVIQNKGSKLHDSDKSIEVDVTITYLERVEKELERHKQYGIVFVDKPGGDNRSEECFIADCFNKLQSGTDYISYKHIALNLITTMSRRLRLIQVADFIVGCTLSFVSGERKHSPEIFRRMKPLFVNKDGYIGGYGIKIHPDYTFRNLYYWLFNDDKLYSKNRKLPEEDRPYCKGPDEY